MDVPENWIGGIVVVVGTGAVDAVAAVGGTVVVFVVVAVVGFIKGFIVMLAAVLGCVLVVPAVAKTGAVLVLGHCTLVSVLELAVGGESTGLGACWKPGRKPRGFRPRFARVAWPLNWVDGEAMKVALAVVNCGAGVDGFIAVSCEACLVYCTSHAFDTEFLRNFDSTPCSTHGTMQLRSHRSRHHITALSAGVLQRVSVELIDWVLDFLHDDFDTLKNCSLVCKAWLPTTRLHLFESVVVSGWKAGEFFLLISSPHSRLSSVIRSFHIGNPIGSSVGSWKLTKRVLDGLATLKALRSLTLVRVNICGILPAWVEFLGAGDLRRLVISRITIDDVHQLMQILCTFSHLEHISLLDVRFKPSQIAPAICSPSMPRSNLPTTLRELAINILSQADISFQILEWILHCETLPSIHTLSIGTIGTRLLDVERTRASGRMVLMLRETLEHLELRLTSLSFRHLHGEEGMNVHISCSFSFVYIARIVFLASIDLSQTVRLRSLRICFGTYCSIASFNLVETFLGRLCSPVIQSVLFQFDAGFWSWKRIPLRTLARNLTRHLGSLTEVVFELQVSSKSPRWIRNPLLASEAENTVKKTMGYPIADLVKVNYDLNFWDKEVKAPSSIYGQCVEFRFSLPYRIVFMASSCTMASSADDPSPHQ
jgi:hypothetical protein